MNVAAPEVPASVALALVVAAGVALYVWKKGGIAQAASSAGAAAVNAAGSAASGAVGAVGASVGLPTPDQTTTDPDVARWLIDHAGYFEASKWSGAPALFHAMLLPAGSGRAPAAGSALAAAFPPLQLTTGDFTRTDHGYDTPNGLPPVDIFNPSTYGIGL